MGTHYDANGNAWNDDGSPASPADIAATSDANSDAMKKRRDDFENAQNARNKAAAAHEAEMQRQRDAGNFIPAQASVLPPPPDPAAVAQAEAEQKLNNHFEYGGAPGGAAAAANRYATIGANAQNRGGEVIDKGRSQSYGAQAQENAAAEGRVAELMWNRATGKTPSIAGMRADEDMRRLSAAQTSAAASARGPAALALAQQGAAANTAAGTSQISNMAQANIAQERMDAEKNAYGAYSGMRGQDFQGQGLEQDMAAKQAAMNQAARDANDKMQLGMTGAEVDVNKAQLGAQGNQIGIAVGAQTAANNLAGQKDIHDQDRSDGWWKLAAGTGATVAGMGLMAYLGGSKSGSGSGGGVGGTGGEPDSSGGTPGGSNPSNSPGDGYYTDDGRWINSDIRGKTDIDTGGNRVDAFLDGIKPLSYHYKSAASEPRSTPTGGRYLGISAQDLEAVPEVGHQMVSEGPRGKQIEVGPSLSAALAGVGRLNQRVRELEGDTAAQSEGQMSRGPSVGGERPMTARERALLAEAGGMQGGIAAQRSMLDDGPSVRGDAPPAWLRREMERPDTFTSDMRAKEDVQSEGGDVRSARRQAFIEGMSHANDAADTGTFGPRPDYMDDPSVVKQQPTTEGRRAAGIAATRADGAYQRRQVAANTTDMHRAAVLGVPVFGASASMGADLMRGDVDASNDELRRYSQRPASLAPIGTRSMQSFTRGDAPSLASLYADEEGRRR